MKFLCERCKTRYSIGDDRVRGKILKIRCKNCANVITVREGMGEAPAADANVRRARNTTQAPSAIAQGAASAKPPPALEEEWYVSIDGEQEGPFSLVDAQRWVASKPFDADLHCWSEGFDDWLPVDKVSHFRGLRKKPVPSAPPPIPRAATASAGLRTTAPRTEDTPKPLFAATMASLEKSTAPAPTPSPLPSPSAAAGLGLPSLTTPARPSATPPGGERALHQAFKAKGTEGDTPPAKANGAAKPAVATPAATPAAKDLFEANDQPTQIDSAPFDDAAPTAAAKPVTESRPPEPAASEDTTSQPITARGDSESDGDTDDEDDDLSIGEVSRVVNLADLMAGGRAKTQGAAPVARRSSPALGNTAAIAKLRETGAIARIDDPDAAAAAPGAAADQAAIAPAVQQTHRRGLVVLIGVAALLLSGVIVAVVMLVGGGSGGMSSLGRTGGIDTTRPDDPTRKIGPQGTGSATEPPVNPYLPPQPRPVTRPKNPVTNNPVDEPLPGGNRIGGDEVETMARSQQATTQRCYMRAQRGAEAIIVGDIKKLNVTIDIAPDGVVRSVSLDKAADTGLGKCLIGAIKLWKFRASPGGTYRFALVFAST